MLSFHDNLQLQGTLPAEDSCLFMDNFLLVLNQNLMYDLLRSATREYTKIDYTINLSPKI